MQGMKWNGRRLENGKDNKRTAFLKTEDADRCVISILEGVRETRNLNSVPKVRSERKWTISAELAVASTYFNNIMIRINFQFRTTL